MRADIAVYRDRRPLAIVEVKMFDDGKSIAAIVADRDKMKKLSDLCGVECYLGVLVTDVETGETCTERVHKLGIALKQKFDLIGDRRSVDGAWEWCFASVRIA